MKLKSLSFGLISSALLFFMSAKAEDEFKGECRNVQNLAHDCEVDNTGKVIAIGMYNDEGISDTDWEKILSYKTIKKLKLSGINRKGFNQNLINRIGSLINLENLEIGSYSIFAKNLNYDSFKNLKKVSELIISGNDEDGKLEKNIINNFKNLKLLDISDAKLDNNDIKEINSLTRIEKMVLYKDIFAGNLKYDFKNVNELVFQESEVEKNFFSSFKNLKKLSLNGDIPIEQYYIDEISTLSNLEEFIYSLDNYSNENVINLDPLKKLKNLIRCYVEINYKSLYIKNINNIRNLHLSVLNDITQENVETIGNLKNIVFLKIVIGEDEQNIDLTPIKKNQNISEIIIEGSNDKYDHEKTLKQNLIKGFNNIKKLTLDNIEFRQNDINDISSLIQIEELNFKNCNFDKINVEPLNNLPKLKIIDFTENSGYKGKTLTNKSLEKCLYDEYDKNDICIDKNTKCLSKNIEAIFKPCK